MRRKLLQLRQLMNDLVSNPNSGSLKVKDVAEFLDISSKTLKKLETTGIFPKPERNHWGWRVYNPEILPELKRRLREYQKSVHDKKIVKE